jgi:hypothetical protein
MPPTPQAVAYFVTHIMNPAQLENFISQYLPEGIPIGMLRAALGFPEVGVPLYQERMASVALQLVMARHQRSPAQVLQELNYLPMVAPLPPIEVGGFLFYLRVRCLQCCGSGSESGSGSTCFWASWIRIRIH